MEKNKEKVYQILNAMDFGSRPERVKTDDPKRFIVEYAAKAYDIKDKEAYVKKNLREVGNYKDTYTFDDFVLEKPRRKVKKA